MSDNTEAPSPEPAQTKDVGPADDIASLRPGAAKALLEEWDQFVEKSPQGCIFCYSWWLEAVCPGQYEILVLRRGGKIVGGLPLCHTKYCGFAVIRMPQLTQTLGILLAPAESANYEKKLSSDMEITSRLIAALPPFRYLNICLHGNFTNWLPFYWQGYEQTTQYSYVLEDLSDLNKVFAGFAHAKRKNIKKAEAEVTVHEDMPADKFFDNHRATLAAQGEKISYDFALFQRLHAAAHEHNAGKTWWAEDAQGNIHAAIFVVFDAKSAYYLVSSIDPRFRNSGAATLLVKRAIEYVAPRTQRFDFEGSMIEGVEHSFRKFGAAQKSYFRIGKANMPLVAKFLIALWRRKRGRLLGG